MFIQQILSKFYDAGYPLISDKLYDKIFPEESSWERSSSGRLVAPCPPCRTIKKYYHNDEISFRGFEGEKCQLEYKLDGCSFIANYENGDLKYVGTPKEDNTCLVYHKDSLKGENIYGLPTHIEGFSGFYKGEVIIPKGNSKTPRSTVAGVTSRKNRTENDPILDIYFITYSKWNENDQSWSPIQQSLSDIGILTFYDIDKMEPIICDQSEVINKINLMYTLRETFDFHCDGVVVKQISGETPEKGHYARGAFAFKNQDKIDWYDTTILDFVYDDSTSIGTTVTAIIDPVIIKGTEVKKVYLATTSNLEKRGFKIGQKVKVGLSGDVIPVFK